MNLPHTTKKISLLAFLLLFTFSCRTFRELKNLAQCDFTSAGIDNLRLAGINLQEKTDISEVNVLDIASLLKSFSQKTLPLNFTFNINISNPNDKLAALNYLEWIAEIDKVEIARGVVNQRYEIPAGENIVMPLQISSDLYKIFSQKEGRELIGKAIGIKDENNQPKNLTLRVKPSISVGKGYIKYPGYIVVKKKIG
ncbi:hypothetical protein [Raineya orbicola]|jgi:hypothetical protein|uniref:Late embryogenesis abundant protein n=1 Tax=Raineya orbicola TaxID=2016530 RepID=A0A2N3IB10_9BACT|nr:hypothetical protein [Raineya orbicola]PKQ67423.1 Late embryogenesis abundant protein [Raineya orbicola]